MINRYTRPEMGNLWTLHKRFEMMKRVEVSVAQAQSEQGIIPKEAYEPIKNKAKFSVERVAEIEKETKHDVIAFVTNLAENVGEYGRYIHFGLTSSDVLDTAMSLQVREAESVLSSGVSRIQKAFLQLIEEEKATMCSGRTHGMHAEPTTFGYKLCGFYEELTRALDHLKSSLSDFYRVKLSGAVGTYSFLPDTLELRVGEILNLKQERFATQVIPRDRHAKVITAIALVGAHLERLSVELRHLQRSEVNEVLEGFTKGQKGSSAMPHKKNPISAENLTGVARLLRGYSLTAQENVALWHERDISHSSAERVIFPDAFILLDYSLHRMSKVLENLVVNREQMKKNMMISKGNLFSSHVLLALVEKGLSREDAYKKVQSHAHGLEGEDMLFDSLKKDSTVLEKLTPQEIDDIFSGKKYLKSISEKIDSYLSQQKFVNFGESEK